MDSIVQKIRRSVARQSSDVVLRKDMLRFGSSARVDVALAQLVDIGSLIRIGRGVYAKTRKTASGDVVLEGSFWALSREALSKLGVEYEVHPLIRAWEAGETDQIPMRLIVKTATRVSRKMSVGQIGIEYVSKF
ncbi:type IV toxin-antitoxin system AbiEi family antitoxin domain-containing protein [Candidatus Aquiluna sp. UB-MaderosW2red]|uniref:type IV toxin-antitoxin system AbiEi family antitoxin domain-containing protein n=1 Tax=Candidatus Aquiluna sp. UB-MaderosW2red TaxID=1855377 RepID=UPI000875E55E|nr:type IV toxin-antitoxin system AbiEi family antitoxin domain-containing protein [Candidatus Aquiluna sp. UB-MaderosW2red]SCX09310.1 hypothetical protein SAMN05216534_0907 [Candidatus Aquiluna sp. UB-MaderosW2red]